MHNQGQPVNSTLLRQMPRLSAYDPGATGEGSLDPLGLAAVADRIADLIVPGLRARMSNPRFATLCVVGATAGHPLRDAISSDGKTTVDIAFEWIVLEALVRAADADAARGVPGSQKARRAVATNSRLSASSYLVAPRVFGFNGVYRPFCRDSELLDAEGSPAVNAERLILAWEADQRVEGFISGRPGSPGHSLREEIERQCRRALEAGHAVVPRRGQFLTDLARVLSPSRPGPSERAELRSLVATGPHGIRCEIAHSMIGLANLTALTEPELASRVSKGASTETRRALSAAIRYEECATALDRCFRWMLSSARTTEGVFSFDTVSPFQRLQVEAKRIPSLVATAIEAVGQADLTLAHEVSHSLGAFEECTAAEGLFETLIQRHDHVQAAKGKRMWIDPIGSKWRVRPTYVSVGDELQDGAWLHQMRLNTLASFLEATS